MATNPLREALETVRHYAPQVPEKQQVIDLLTKMLPTADVDVFLCRDCGEEFYLTAGQRGFFEAKRLSIPSRCVDCRRRRKELYGGGR
jgi:hypothetical protein